MSCMMEAAAAFVLRPGTMSWVSEAGELNR